MDGVGKRVSEDAHGPRGGDPGRDLDEDGVLHELRRPGAPPTLRRISMYSTGFETRCALMLESSHVDSSSRCLVFSKKRLRHSIDLLGTVRNHRLARPRSTALVGSGMGVERSTGMKRGSRSRYFFEPAWS